MIFIFALQYAEQIAHLVGEMGFRRADVISCLEAVDGDTEEALELLMGIKPANEKEGEEKEGEEAKKQEEPQFQDLPSHLAVEAFAAKSSRLCLPPSPHRIVAHFSLAKATVVLLPSKYEKNDIFVMSIFDFSLFLFIQRTS